MAKKPKNNNAANGSGRPAPENRPAANVNKTPTFTAEELDKENQKQRAAELRKREEELNRRELELINRETKVGERELKLDQIEKAHDEVLKKEAVDAKISLEAKLAAESENSHSELMKNLEARRMDFESDLKKLEADKMAAAQKDADSMREDARQQAADIRGRAETELQNYIDTMGAQAKEKNDNADKRAEMLDQREEALIAERDRVYKYAETVARKENEAETAKAEYDHNNARLKQTEEDLEKRKKDIDVLVEERYPEIKIILKAEIEEQRKELELLRDKNRELMERQNEEANQREAFVARFHDDPAVLQSKVAQLEATIDRLESELATRASADDSDKLARLEKQHEEDRNLIEQLQNENDRYFGNENGQRQLRRDNIELESEKERLETVVRELTEKVRVLVARDIKEVDREECLAAIKRDFFEKQTFDVYPENKSELEWLQNIYDNCNSYGIHFPKRILYAFHTALKISDWSSITVLAGVSGTGKSELPNLYAAFGGMNFISVPVQPDWDSQESMLGFYNSIENKFEPERLLRFLVQCTEEEGESARSNYMSIVLLDEMNLAHVEYYFANFLSKLETRRGHNKDFVPTIEIKLGAGVDPYELQLKRTILWTGTMNQDETTKSLSDKVLDRGLVINFPRPRELKGRESMPTLEKFLGDKKTMLRKKTWANWVVRKIDLQGEQLKEMEQYKKVVEAVNNEMDNVGRAIGHRVWQSIEYYIVNYPTVKEEMSKHGDGSMTPSLRKNMRIAFEDQIVQKIMPKLRGVETRGKSRECLVRIKELLVDEGPELETLQKDFDNALERGYGQFIWCSANYIKDEDAVEDELQNGDLIDSEDDEQSEADTEDVENVVDADETDDNDDDGEIDDDELDEDEDDDE